MKKLNSQRDQFHRRAPEEPTEAHRKTHPLSPLKNIFFLLKFGFKKHQKKVRKKKSSQS